MMSLTEARRTMSFTPVLPVNQGLDIHEFIVNTGNLFARGLVSGTDIFLSDRAALGLAADLQDHLLHELRNSGHATLGGQ